MKNLTCEKCGNNLEKQSYIRDNNEEVIGFYCLCPICGHKQKIMIK